MKSSREWVTQLQLEKHISGAGFFKPVYQSKDVIKKGHLSEDFGGDRLLCSSIYYLLEEGQIASLHKVKSDEQFSHIDGGSMGIYIFNEDEKSFSYLIIGKDTGESPHTLIPKNCWFGYAVLPDAKYTLLTCTLSPAFHLDDFQLATDDDKERLSKLFPEHDSLIETLTPSKSEFKI